jgi:hypothetical protein
MTAGSCGQLAAYDGGNGAILITWAPFPGVAPSSYNVYVNGVLNQSVSAPARKATITGLVFTTYNSAAIAPPGNGSARPQNLPPNGVVTPSDSYDFKVTAVVAGVEVSASADLTVTASPVSIMLKTPMKRLWPFPNTGLD